MIGLEKDKIDLGIDKTDQKKDKMNIVDEEAGQERITVMTMLKIKKKRGMDTERCQKVKNMKINKMRRKNQRKRKRLKSLKRKAKEGQRF